MDHKKFWILVLLCLAGWTKGMGQAGLSLGYNLQFFPDAPAGIFSHFRAKNPWLDMEEKKFRALQGVSLGVRNRFDYVAVGASFQYSFWSMVGRGTNPASERSEEQRIILLNSALSAEAEVLISDNFGLGTSLHYNKFTQKLRNSNNGTFKHSIPYWSQDVFLGVYVKGSRHTTLAFRPFFEIPYGKINFFFSESRLNPDRAGTSQKSDFDYKPTSFGLRFLFINGG